MLLPRWLSYTPRDREVAPRLGRSPAPRLRAGECFRLLSWNLQFAGSRSYHFFYDGGRAAHVSRDRVEQSLAQIQQVLRDAAPDLILLQEVDRDSARTQRIDQLARLRAAVPLARWSSTPYHRSRYVPAPYWQPLGRVDMDLSVGSRFEKGWARRQALPGLQESALRQAFNLRRALHEVSIPVEGRAEPLVLLNTHLSAFSYGDGTLVRQLAVLRDRIHRLNDRGYPWILAGDFNLLPPGDDPARLGAEARYYADEANPLIPFFEQLRCAMPLPDYHRDPARFYTYLTFGAAAPDRVLDYLFVSDDLEIHDYRVLSGPEPVSDHLPLVLEASLPAK